MLQEIDEYFAPVPVKRVPLFAHEVLGKDRLQELAKVLYPADEDPIAVTRTDKPYTFEKRDGTYEIRMRLPFAVKGEIGLFKKGDELVGRNRHAAPPHRPAAVHGHVATFPCEAG